jgi:hypothetical protein
MGSPIVGASSDPVVPGVEGTNSAAGAGVYGNAVNAADGIGVNGQGTLYGGNFGSATPGIGIGVNAEGALYGGKFVSNSLSEGLPPGVTPAGVLGVAPNGNGVVGFSTSGIGVFGQGTYAGYFNGTVVVTGDVQLTGGDCAEQFDVVARESCEPGTVMVIDDSGALVPSQVEYDRRVAGVVAGVSELKPSVLLNGHTATEHRRPIALMGKVLCKVVVEDTAVSVGDLLTSSNLAGHAMRVSDPSRAFGAVIGKALQPLAFGTELIWILIALQ